MVSLKECWRFFCIIIQFSNCIAFFLLYSYHQQVITPLFVNYIFCENFQPICHEPLNSKDCFPLPKNCQTIRVGTCSEMSTFCLRARAHERTVSTSALFGRFWAQSASAHVCFWCSTFCIRAQPFRSDFCTRAHLSTVKMHSKSEHTVNTSTSTKAHPRSEHKHTADVWARARPTLFNIFEVPSRLTSAFPSPNSRRCWKRPRPISRNPELSVYRNNFPNRNFSCLQFCVEIGQMHW